MAYGTCPICYANTVHNLVFRGTDAYGKYIEYSCSKCGAAFRVHVRDNSNPKTKAGERDRHRYLKAGTHCKRENRW